MEMIAPFIHHATVTESNFVRHTLIQKVHTNLIDVGKYRIYLLLDVDVANKSKDVQNQEKIQSRGNQIHNTYLVFDALQHLE